MSEIGIRFDEAVRHLQAGRLAEAEQRCQQILAVDAMHADTLHLRGVIACQNGRYEAAIALIGQAISLRDRVPYYHNSLGNVLKAQRKPSVAVEHYERALALKPDFAEAHANLGNTLQDLGKLADAVAHYERALALKPDYAEAYSNLGDTLRAQGRLSQARDAYARAIDIAPGNGRYYRLLLNMRPVVPGDRYLAALEKLAQHMALFPAEDRKQFHFALGKAYADLGQHERSFRHLLEGNALARRGLVYDEPGTLGLFDRIRAVFTADLMQRAQYREDRSAAPIFIVGMPRSGTTLMEQILASHPMVFGAGELEDFPNAVMNLSAGDPAASSFPEIVPALSDEQFRLFGTNYLTAAAPGSLRFTDKMPANFRFAGLIHLALPNARIIHMRRDPIDTCLSCFSILFTNGQPYSYDLAELGRYNRAYEALMEHWRQVLPAGVMLDVRYEDLVDDVERQARQVVAHCGLAWDDACLNHVATQRSIRTASAVQARQPIFRTSVSRWRPYRDFLRPLIEALDFDG